MFRQDPDQNILRQTIADTRLWLAALTAASSDAILGVGLDRRILSWNGGARDVFGYTEAEVLGQDVSIIAFPDSEREQNEIDEKIRRGESIKNYRTARRRKNGEPVLVSLTASPVKDTDGNIFGMMTIVRDVTDYVRAEEAKLFLGSIVESSEDSIVTIDFEGTITTWNKSAEQLYGYPAKEAIGKPLTMLTFSDDLNMLLGYIDKIRRGETVEVFDTVRINKDGRDLHLEIVMSPVKDAAGRIAGISTVARDVSRRKQEERRLRESEERFRAMFEQASVGIVMKTIDGRLTTPNPGFCKFIGYTREETISLNLREITHADDYENEAELTRQLLTGKIPGFSIEKRYVRKDGTLVWGNMTASLVREATGEPFYMLAIVEDIQERKQFEAALRESEERLRLLIESAADYAIFTLSPDNRINSWNAGAEKIFGWTESEILGQSGEIVFTPEDRAKGAPEAELETALEKEHAPDERFHLRKDGTRFYASGVTTLLKDANGVVRGYAKIARDMTERIAAEQSLREKEMLKILVGAQEQERRRIARDLHDELGQQLTALRLKLDALKSLCDSDEICGKIDDIQMIARALDDGVDYLAWELRPAALDDLGLFPAIEKYVGEWSHHSGIRAELLASSLKKKRFMPHVETNLYRIVQEALNNISKHARAQRVEVILERRGDEIVLIVEDDGAGFDPDAELNRDKCIGLIGMQERAALVGGAMEIESAPGSGTTIYVRLPVSTTEAGEN